MWELFGGLETESDDAKSFSGSMIYGTIGDTILCKRASSAYRLKRFEPFTKTGFDCMKLLLQVRGETRVVQDGKVAVVTPGRWCLYDLSQPYELTHSSQTEVMLLTMPRAKLVSSKYELKEVLNNVFPAVNGMEKLAFDFTGRVFDEVTNLHTASAVSTIDMVAELVRLAVRERKNGIAAPLPAKLMGERVRSYIRANLQDPDLDLQKIAVHFKCSKRYLHKSFECDNCSISEWIWLERLERCRADLGDFALSRRSISEIAFRWGFNSATHFSTSFKRRFGMTAKESREQSLCRAAIAPAGASSAASRLPG